LIGRRWASRAPDASAGERWLGNDLRLWYHGPMTPAQEPFLIAEVAVDASDATILTLMRMLDRAHRAGRHKHFICSVVGIDRDAPDPWEQPAFVELCGRLVDSGFVWFLDASTLHPPGQPDHLQAGFGALEVWLASRRMFGAAPPTAAVMAEGLAAVERAGEAAAAALRGSRTV
jgi:hypothetical protein